jgi:hypothetical protein
MPRWRPCFPLVSFAAIVGPGSLKLNSAMRRQVKDRLVSALLILLFLAVMGGSAYFIIRVMTHWNAKGLG